VQDENSRLKDSLAAAQAAAMVQPEPRRRLGAAPPAPGIIGMLIKRYEGDSSVVVDALTPGGPAASSGQIRVGDRLLSVDGRSVASLSLDIVHDLIDGPAGGTITMTLQSAGGTPRREDRSHDNGWSNSPEGAPGGLMGAFTAARNVFTGAGGSGASTPRPSEERSRGGTAASFVSDGEYRVTLVRTAMDQGMPA
jgi:hypothetical protein